jgi:hypothetical protein
LDSCDGGSGHERVRHGGGDGGDGEDASAVHGEDESPDRAHRAAESVGAS